MQHCLGATQLPKSLLKSCISSSPSHMVGHCVVRVKSYELGLLGEVARLGMAMRRWYFSRAAEVTLTTLRMFL